MYFQVTLSDKIDYPCFTHLAVKDFHRKNGKIMKSISSYRLSTKLKKNLVYFKVIKPSSYSRIGGGALHC